MSTGIVVPEIGASPRDTTASTVGFGYVSHQLTDSPFHRAPWMTVELAQEEMQRGRKRNVEGWDD
jgi:hypothetical protein